MTEPAGDSIEPMGQERCNKQCRVRNCPCLCHRAIRRLHVREWQVASHEELVSIGLLVKELRVRRIPR